MSELAGEARGGPWVRFYASHEPNSAVWRPPEQPFTEAGRTAHAIAAYRRAAHRDPVDFPSRHALARLLADNGQQAEALAWERELLTINPYDTAALTRLGATLAESDTPAARREAEGCLREADRLGAPPAYARVALCRLLARQEREAEVVALTEGANAVPLLIQRGRALVALGRFADAADAFVRVLEVEPGQGHAWQQLAGMKRQDQAPGVPAEGGTAAPMRRAESLASAATGRDREQLAFALGAMLEQAGDYAGAWAWYCDANARVRARLPSDIERIEDSEARTVSTFSAATLNRLTAGAVTTPGPMPVFIVGMPRSGTTLLERVLAAHPDVAGLGERGDLRDVIAAMRLAGTAGQLPWPERAAHLAPTGAGAIGGAYLARLHALAPHAQVAIDKLPDNFALVGLIAAVLPQARILHLQRDPRDIALSCYTAPFHDGLAWSYDLDSIARRQASHDRVMAHWASLLPAGRLLRVPYAELAADPDATARQAAAFCGLSEHDNWVAATECPGAPVRTTSAVQAREPIHDRSIGRWRRFAPHAPELNDLL